MLASGAMGYFLSLLPRERPARWLVATVLLPSLASIVAIPTAALLWFRSDLGLDDLALQWQSGNAHWKLSAIQRLVVGFGPGLAFAEGGIALVAIFAELLLWKRVSLPIRLSHSSAHPLIGASAGEEHRSVMRFVWMMISLTTIASALSVALSAAIFWGAQSHLGGPSYASISWMTEVVSSATLLLLVLLAVGKNRKESLQKALHLPPPKYVGLAFLFPAVIACVWPTLNYLQDRILWAGTSQSKGAPPEVAYYVNLPNLAALWYFLPAFVEEIAWRGYLQPRLIRRYGLIRGVFFVGIVWGAFHFVWDFHPSMTAGAALLAIPRRLLITIAYSYVLAWLAIASRSILPAAVAHATLNAFVYYEQPITTPYLLRIGLWAILGFVLFRYFAPQLSGEDRPAESLPTSEAPF